MYINYIYNVSKYMKLKLVADGGTNVLVQEVNNSIMLSKLNVWLVAKKTNVPLDQ